MKQRERWIYVFLKSWHYQGNLDFDKRLQSGHEEYRHRHYVLRMCLVAFT